MSIVPSNEEYQQYHTHEFKLRQLRENIDKHVWLVCAPKSGSTWLTRIFKDALKWPSVALVSGFDHREQELDLSPLLAKGTTGNLLTPHQHCRYSSYTHQVIDALDTKVILQVRNLFDTVMSLYDHLTDDETSIPSAFTNEHLWDALDPDTRQAFIVDLVLPWYFNFYCGWVTSTLYTDGRIELVTYEDLKHDTLGTVSSLLDYCGEHRESAHIQAALDRQETRKNRLNKGVIGRGDSLPDHLKERVRSFTRYYPGVDFGPLGL
ncbi:MAG: sulfotransferase domain-containing protein [Acidobacteria bacterium]|nr:sulfotransferase domain-containing protein [Acidobacteriota bacterium]